MLANDARRLQCSLATRGPILQMLNFDSYLYPSRNEFRQRPWDPKARSIFQSMSAVQPPNHTTGFEDWIMCAPLMRIVLG